MRAWLAKSNYTCLLVFSLTAQQVGWMEGSTDEKGRVGEGVGARNMGGDAGVVESSQ